MANSPSILKIRLYVPTPFLGGGSFALEQGQSHYLVSVMRVRDGDEISVFNGQDGLWRAHVAMVSKKSVTLHLIACVAPQKHSPDLWLVFSPIKNKVDVVVEKAVELGVSNIAIVYTQHSVVKSINHEKLATYAAEAAEQCERLDVPRFEEYSGLSSLLGGWPKDRLLLYGDESGGGEGIKNTLASLPKGKYAILIGPEGGFSAEEHHMLSLLPFVRPFGMGPRILRADTAAIAALSCMQAWLGDWDEKPHFKANEV
jgi:16S rRNA (uracil1498-N3)-methyltransferase